MSFISRLLTVLFLSLALALFCAALTSPIFYALPLNCPEGSRVIGIECFDESYNNTTPWYRQDMGASIASFPFWLIVSLAIVGAGSRIRLGSSTTFINYRPSAKIVPKFETAPPAPATLPKDWLPTNCPHCGGSLSSANVQWLSKTEAKCPYCGGTVKA